jgi:predicted amidohydrolase
MLVDPHGEILADAGEGEGILRAELDLGSLRQYRQGLPFLDDLRWPGLK